MHGEVSYEEVVAAVASGTHGRLTVMTDKHGRFELDPIPGGFRVKTSSEFHMDVLLMLFNWRIVTTLRLNPDMYDRGWCYEGRNPETALWAALEWDPDMHHEPEGWIKEVGTDRRRSSEKAGSPVRYAWTSMSAEKV